MNEHAHGVGMGLMNMLSEAEYQAGQSRCLECGSLSSSPAHGEGHREPEDGKEVHTEELRIGACCPVSEGGCSHVGPVHVNFM